MTVRKIIGSVARNWFALLTLGLGALIGVLLRWPTGWELSSPNAELIGSAIGAIIAIGGAVLVWHIQESTRIDRLVRSVVNSVLVGLGYLMGLAKAPAENRDEVMRLAGSAKEHVRRSRNDITLFQREMTTVSPAQSRTFRRLQYLLEKIDDDLEGAIAWAGEPRELAPIIEIGQKHQETLSEYCKALLEDRAIAGEEE